MSALEGTVIPLVLIYRKKKDKTVSMANLIIR